MKGLLTECRPDGAVPQGSFTYGCEEADAACLDVPIHHKVVPESVVRDSSLRGGEFQVRRLRRGLGN